MEVTPSNEPYELKIHTDITIEKLMEIFPKNKNPEDLRITDIGVYSITKKNEAYFITNLITKFFGNEKISITDSTACVGGNTISFILNEQIWHVNSVELNKLHFDILKHNIKSYKESDKIVFYNNNYLNIMNELKQDVIFYDLPWGGIDYKKNEMIMLGLYDDDNNYVKITEIVNEQKNNSKLQVLKLPLNFDFTNFFHEIIYNKIKIHKIFNKFTKKLCYFLVILVN